MQVTVTELRHASEIRTWMHRITRRHFKRIARRLRMARKKRRGWM